MKIRDSSNHLAKNIIPFLVLIRNEPNIFNESVWPVQSQRTALETETKPSWPVAEFTHFHFIAPTTVKKKK